MPRVDIKTIIKDLNKDELKDLISVAKGVLSGLFSSDEIKDDGNYYTVLPKKTSVQVNT